MALAEFLAEEDFDVWCRFWMDQLFEMAEIFSKMERRSFIGTLAQTSYSSLGMAAPSGIVSLISFD